MEQMYCFEDERGEMRVVRGEERGEKGEDEKVYRFEDLKMMRRERGEGRNESYEGRREK